MGTLIQSYTFRKTVVDIYDDGLTTVFPEAGVELFACPEDTPEYKARAIAMGYGKDILLMSQEHELAHTILAIMMGLDYSPTLFGVAMGKVYPYWGAEEEAVLGLQRYSRALGISILADLPGRFMEDH